jgi:hypothetical protein
MNHYRILSIDAWREEGGWYWNNSFTVGYCQIKDSDLTTRKILRKMRNWGFLTEKSKGLVKILDFSERSMEIQNKNSDEPIYALEYMDDEQVKKEFTSEEIERVFHK